MFSWTCLLNMSKRGKPKRKSANFRVSRPYLDGEEETPVTLASSFSRQNGRIIQRTSLVDSPSNAGDCDHADESIEDGPACAKFFQDMAPGGGEAQIQGGEMDIAPQKSTLTAEVCCAYRLDCFIL